MLRPESRSARDVQSGLASLADRIDPPPPPPSGSIVVKTTTVTAYPTVAVEFYGCVVSLPGGVENETSVPTFADGTGVLFVINLGSAIPPAGTRLIADSVNGRYVMRYDG